MNNEGAKKYVSEMILAIQANIEYLQKEGSSSLKLRNGELVSNVDDLFIYEFELEFFQEIEEEADVEIRVGKESASGKVIGLTEKKFKSN